MSEDRKDEIGSFASIINGEAFQKLCKLAFEPQDDDQTTQDEPFSSKAAKITPEIQALIDERKTLLEEEMQRASKTDNPASDSNPDLA